MRQQKSPKPPSKPRAGPQLSHTHSTYGTYTLLLLHGNIFLPQTRLWCKKEKKNRLKAIFMHSKCLHHFKKASHRPFCTVTNLNGKKTGKEVFHVELENKMWDVTFLVHFWISHSHFLRCYCLLLWLLLSPPLTHSAKALGTTQKTKYVCTIQITESRNIMCFFSVCFCLFLCFFCNVLYLCWGFRVHKKHQQSVDSFTAYFQTPFGIKFSKQTLCQKLRGFCFYGPGDPCKCCITKHLIECFKSTTPPDSGAMQLCSPGYQSLSGSVMDESGFGDRQESCLCQLLHFVEDW